MVRSLACAVQREETNYHCFYVVSQTNTLSFFVPSAGNLYSRMRKRGFSFLRFAQCFTLSPHKTPFLERF